MSDAMDYSLFADLYDAYVRSDLDIPFFLQETRGVKGDVLELMAGTGRVSLPLLEAGVRLTCLDASPDMLERLRQKVDQRGLSADIHRMDVRAFDLGKQFELIFIPFHAFAELISTTDQAQVLGRIRQHLSSQGRFICTLHNPPVRLQRVDGPLRLWASAPMGDSDGKLLVWGLENYEREAEIVRGMQFFESYDPRGVLVSKRLVEYRFKIIEKDDFERMAKSAGLRVEAIYGDYAYGAFEEGKSSFMIWKLSPAASD